MWTSSTVPIGRKGEKAEKVEGKRKELILLSAYYVQELWVL